MMRRVVCLLRLLRWNTATRATTAAAFAGAFVEFFATTTARPLVLRTTAAAGLRHASCAAHVLALVVLPRLRIRRAGTIAGCQGNLEFVEFIPLGIGAIAIGDRQQFLHAGAGRLGRDWGLRIVHAGIISNCSATINIINKLRSGPGNPVIPGSDRGQSRKSVMRRRPVVWSGGVGRQAALQLQAQVAHLLFKRRDLLLLACHRAVQFLEQIFVEAQLHFNFGQTGIHVAHAADRPRTTI